MQCHTPWHSSLQPMDLGPVIRIIENAPARHPAERQPGAPAPKEPAPAQEPTPA
jgi:hypothetical protein